MEEKKKSGFGTILIIIIVLAIGVGGGFYLSRYLETESTGTSSKKTTDNNKAENLELTAAVKSKLERFINVATTPNVAISSEPLKSFLNGLTDLTKQIKLTMTTTAIYNDKLVTSNVVASERIRNNIEGVKPEQNEEVDAISVAVYNNTYKELFGEEASYEFSELGSTGCPAPAGINNELQVMYLLHRCGGDSETTYERKITNYKSDAKYYYVNQTINEKNASGTTEYKLTWKFDKDMKFVSATKE